MCIEKKPTVAPPPIDRLQKLDNYPRLKDEAVTIRRMVELFCASHHQKHPNQSAPGSQTLCTQCSAFLEYALKRLACCPYGEKKPVCGKCRIHCYRAQEKELARTIMRWAGPRLMWHHPILALKHLLATRVPAPDKPRNRGSKK